MKVIVDRASCSSDSEVLEVYSIDEALKILDSRGYRYNHFDFNSGETIEEDECHSYIIHNTQTDPIYITVYDDLYE